MAELTKKQIACIRADARRQAKLDEQQRAASQASPGPWKARDYKNKEGDIWIDCDSWANPKTASCRGGTIATVMASGIGDYSVEATARLIAAAPELLAACRDVIDCTSADGGVFIPANGTTIRTISALLAKVEGGAK